MDRTEAIGRYTLRQTADVFPLCGDTLALGRFATVKAGQRVCDLGCGSGALGLLLAARTPQLTVTAIDRDPAAAALANENLAQIGGTAICEDLRAHRGQYDLVISNPPYFADGAGRPGTAARTETGCTIEDLCAAAGRLVRTRGRFALVHRPERLAALFAALAAHGLEPKRMTLLHHSSAHPPSAVLIEAVRQGNPGLSILAPIFIHDTIGGAP